jgi:hypothetical protein
VSKNHLHAFACAYLHNYKYKGLDATVELTTGE